MIIFSSVVVLLAVNFWCVISSTRQTQKYYCCGDFESECGDGEVPFNVLVQWSGISKIRSKEAGYYFGPCRPNLKPPYKRSTPSQIPPFSQLCSLLQIAENFVPSLRSFFGYYTASTTTNTLSTHKKLILQ